MFTLEPIPELSAFLMAVKMARLTEEGASDSVTALETKSRGVKSSDRVGWLGIYKEALSLIPRVKAAQAARDAAKRSSAGGQAMRQRLSSIGSGLSNGMSRAQQDWQPRLATQEREVFQRAERALSTLPVESSVDKDLGELVFRYEANALEEFWNWLGRAEKEWTNNNASLVALRANEAIVDSLQDLPPEISFRVEAARLEPAAIPRPKLKGQKLPNPGFFASLGSTYRFIMSAVTASSGLGFFAARVIGDKVAAFLPPVLGAVFLVTVIVAAMTIPKERRQTMARLKSRSTEGLERELREAIRERLKGIAEGQASAIKKHLASEGSRFRSLAREAAGSDPSPQTPQLSAMSGGLLPADAARLDGEWKDAFSRRVVEIEAEIASGAASASAFAAGPSTSGLPNLPPMNWNPPNFRKS